jgi:hypothetical protein
LRFSMALPLITGPSRPLTFTMVHLIPKPFLPSPCFSKSWTEILQNRLASSMRRPPDHVRSWSSALSISYQRPFLPSPTACPSGVDQGGTEALPSLNCHLVHGLEKVLLRSAVFPLNQIEKPPRPPSTHYVRKQQLSLACRLAFVI